MYMIWLGWVIWHNNHCSLFNPKSGLANGFHKSLTENNSSQYSG